MQLPASILRVACDVTNLNSFNNAVNNQAAVIPRAGSVQIACALFIGPPGTAANLVGDLSNILTANLVLRAGTSPTGTVLVEKVLAAPALNPGLTYAQWTGGAAAHFTFSLSPTDTNQTAGNVFIGIGVTTTNAGDVPCAFSATARIVDYGIFNPGAPTAADYTSWSKAESDARYALLGSVAGGDFAPAITSVGDGAATSLEAVPTAGLTAPVLRTLAVGSELQNWLLVAGTDATDTDANGNPAHQRPNDFNASTNAQVWVRR